MSIFKRLSATVASRVEHLVGEIENHEAVVDATLKDMQHKIAQAKVRLAQVNREKSRLDGKIEELKEKAQHWRTRAIESAQKDEETALKCLGRAKHCDQQCSTLLQSQQQYQATVQKLTDDIDSAQQQLVDTRQKHTLMRARQSTSAALKATTETDQNINQQQLEDTFDRWEVSILETELTNNQSADFTHENADTFEQEFIAREEREALSQELATLIKKEYQND